MAGTIHCSSQPFLSGTKPNLHTQDISHGLGGFFLRRCGDMGIGVQGEASREVAQHTGHRLDVDTVLQRDGCEGVAEVMESDLRDACSFEDALQHIVDTVRGDGATVGRGKEKEFCMNRLPVSYNPDAPKPEKWLAFLEQLLYPEDIPTLQEYMGYCLIPSTKAQQMLFLIGNGGEGKSRIGLVMHALLGNNMNTGSVAKIETSNFARADQQFKYLLVDDDMKLEALPQTNHIKTIVTAELPMDLEKKGEQSYQGELYVRFMVFGNGSLRALYDHSDGFYRRQLILSVKPRDKSRKDDPYIAEKMCAEAEGIFLWALEGLHRLTQNDFHITQSERTRANVEAAMREGNNILGFMESEGYFLFKADDWITSKDFYTLYTIWCDDNSEKPLSPRTFSNFLCANEQKYNLEHNNNGFNAQGRRVWGFLGVRSLIKIF